MLYHLIAFSAAVATGTADEDCLGYHYKINGVCTGVQQFANARGCGVANGGIASHPLALDRAFCEEFGTARPGQQVPMVSWGNLGKPGAATFAGEVNDPTIPSGCVAHSNSNTYQWNTAVNGAPNGWWRLVCMTEEAAPAPAPRDFTKCKEVVPDRSMSIKNGANAEAVQLCKVINGSPMSPMWGPPGKDSDCGTDAALISASTDSVDDCRALCDAFDLCLGWAFWDQTRLATPRNDQGCYLFGSGTSDQLVADRVFGDNSPVAAGTCFPEPHVFTKCTEVVPDRGMSIKNGANGEAVQLCKVINGSPMSPMWGPPGKDSDCGTNSLLISASTNSVDDCRALCDAFDLCLGWWFWDQTRLAIPRNDQGCYLFGSGTSDQLVADRVFGDNSAVASGTCFPDTAPPSSYPGFTNVGQGWCQDASGRGFRHYRIEQPGITETQCITECRNMPECGSINYYPASNICIVDVDHAVSPAGAPAPLWTMVSGGQGMHPVTSVDPSPDTVCFGKDTPVVPSSPPTEPPSMTAPPTTDPSTCQKVMLKSGNKCLHTQGPNATSMWMTCPADSSTDPLFKFDIIPVDPANPNLVKIQNSAGQYVSFQSPWVDPAVTRDWSSMYHQVWERRITSTGVQFFNAGRNAFLASDPAVNNGFAGFTTTDSASASTFAASSSGCGSAPTAPPTEPPTTCDCRQTDKTHAEGARCIDPHHNTIGYRQTANWCCSDYGCSKGYKWIDPVVEGECHDDTFIGTCMFSFIQAGGCNIVPGQNDDAIMAAVNPDCFDCDHIGELVDQECMGGSSNPLVILSDMINDARRLSGTSLPAGDAKLEKINKRIAKIRTLLKEKKLAAKTALGRHP